MVSGDQLGLAVIIGLAVDFSILLLVQMMFTRIKGEKIGLKDLVKAPDGHYSLAYLQFFLWTFVVVFAFTTIYMLRVQLGEFVPPTDMPRNILILMGISVTTPVISKEVSKVKYGIGSEEKNDTGKHQHKFQEMFLEKDRPTLTRYQMFAWTVVSILIYLITLATMLVDPNLTTEELILPNIDPALVVLMGLSQGGYLGGKIVTAGAMKISEILPSAGTKGEEVSILGINFGDQKGIVDFGGKRIKEFGEDQWTNTRIDVKIPEDLEPGEYNVKVKFADRTSKSELFVVKSKEPEDK